MAPKPPRARTRVRDARSVSPPPASASGSGGARARSRSRSPRRTKLDADVKHIDTSVAKKLATAVFCCDTCATVHSTRESCLVSACGCMHLVLCDRKSCQSHVTPDRECALHHMRKHEASCKDQKRGKEEKLREVVSYSDWAYGSDLEPWPLDLLPVRTMIQGERELFHLRVKLSDDIDELATGAHKMSFEQSTAEYDAGQYFMLPVRAEVLKAAVLKNTTLLSPSGRLEPVDDKTNAVLCKEFVCNEDFRKRVAFVSRYDHAQQQPVNDVRLKSTLSSELVTHDTYAQFLMDCHVDGGMFRTGISIHPLPDDHARLFPREEDTSRAPTANLKQLYSDVNSASLAILDAKATPDSVVDAQIAKLDLLTKQELASLPSDVEFRLEANTGGVPGKYVSTCPMESRFSCPCRYADCLLSQFLWDRYIASIVNANKPLDATAKRLVLFYAAHALHLQQRITASASASKG